MEAESRNGGRDFMEEESAVTMIDERNRRIDDHSSALAEKLLQGWTLLNEHCPQCLTPLVRNRQKKMYCAVCKQWILTESEAAAKALQQRSDRRDLTEERCNTNREHTTPSTSVHGAPVAPSPAPQVNVKTNGIGQLRLSLATLRAEEGKPQDGRHPKRLASADHVQDPKEIGNHGRPGVPTSFQHPSPAQVPSNPALVLQPTVNPVNDILVARRTLTTLNEKLEGIRQLISNTLDVYELRRLFAILEECIHAIEVIRQLLKSLE